VAGKSRYKGSARADLRGTAPRGVNPKDGDIAPDLENIKLGEESISVIYLFIYLYSTEGPRRPLTLSVKAQTANST